MSYSMSIAFRDAVLDAVRDIPVGKVMGYKDVACKVGYPKRARHVGFVLSQLPPDTTVPWWRVIRSDGSIAMQGSLVRGDIQVEHLKAEKVPFKGKRSTSYTVDIFEPSAIFFRLFSQKD